MGEYEVCGESQGCEIALGYVIPALGVCTATAIFLSPIKAIIAASRKNDIGPLNPIPLAFMIANCLGQVYYGLLIKNWFVFSANGPGFIIGVYYTLEAYALSTQHMRKRVMWIACFFPALLTIAAQISFVIDAPFDVRQNTLGITALVVAAVFFSSPLSSLWQVIRDKDSSSILLPLALTCLINNTFWLIYGIVLKDIFIMAPNVAGLACALAQFALRAIFPQRAARDAPREEEVVRAGLSKV